MWSLRSTVLCISEIRTSCNTVPKVTTRHVLHRWMKVIWCTLQVTPCSLCAAVQSVVCCQDSTSKSVMVPFASRASNHWKHDMGILLWFINAETHKKVPTPLFGRLVRCSTHGHSFARLRYVCILCGIH